MRWLTALVVVIALVAAVGCGDQQSVSDSTIINALNLKPGDQGPVYAIDGDPFCEVDQDLLNDSDEIDQAKQDKSLEGLVITNDGQTVGVKAVPPFDNACEAKVRRSLDQIDSG
jgi:hypothetical protein